MITYDIDTTPAGVDYRLHYRKAIDASRVVLVLIGRNWSDPTAGVSRLLDPTDHVRIEVEEAIRGKKHIIPIHVGKIDQLISSEMPESLLSLTRLHYIQFGTPREFYIHSETLLSDINYVLFDDRYSKAFYLLWRQISGNYWRAFSVSVAVLALILLSWSLYLEYRLPAPAQIVESLATYDPSAFSGSINGNYQIARAMADRETLTKETNLAKIIEGSRKSFDIFALRGGALTANQSSLRIAIKNGVKVRVILIDHNKENLANLTATYETISSKTKYGEDLYKADILKTINYLRILQDEINTDHQNMPGSLEVKWLRCTFLNSIWIRDFDDDENALGHIEVSFYGNINLNPSFRFGRFSRKIINRLHQQFEDLWKAANSDLPCNEGVSSP